MLESLEIPDDLEACQRLLREVLAANQRLQEINAELLDSCNSMQDARQKLEQEKEELALTVKELMNRLYGRRSERHHVSPDQLMFDFGEEGVLQFLGDVTEEEAFVAGHEERRRDRRKGKQKNKTGGRFPDHLLRRTERIEPILPEGINLEDCQLLGIDVVELLEFERPQLWVQRYEYPKYKIPERPELNVVQGDRQASLIPGGSFGFGIAAEVLFNKFALHVPLYRQQDPFSQWGWAPNRSTLCQIVRNSAHLLWPLAMLETERVLGCWMINTDDTTVRLLTPGEGKGSRTARLWIYRGNYLRDVLERLAKGDCDLEELLPDVWKTTHPQYVRAFRAEERQHRADERRYRRSKKRIEAAKALNPCGDA